MTILRFPRSFLQKPSLFMCTRNDENKTIRLKNLMKVWRVLDFTSLHLRNLSFPVIQEAIIPYLSKQLLFGKFLTFSAEERSFGWTWKTFPPVSQWWFSPAATGQIQTTMAAFTAYSSNMALARPHHQHHMAPLQQSCPSFASDRLIP